MNKKTIILALVIIIIVASIYFLEQTTSEGKGEVIRETLNTTQTERITPEVNTRIQEKEAKYDRAVELVEPEGYFNTEEFLLQDHVGKQVILIDFWTYSCINCQRTLPYLNAWQDTYGDEGLLIVGVHTPEFEFEKKPENVQTAINKYGITYAVVQDNDKQTWKAYNNRYWPRKYLIDIDGFIVYDHIGEGGYAQTEQKIRELLEERSKVLGIEMSDEERVNVVETLPDFQQIETPEIYFGYDFSRGQLGNEEGWKPEEMVEYVLPTKRFNNKFYLAGTWKNNEDNMELVSEEGIVEIRYTAKTINVVAGATEPTTITSTVGEETTTTNIQNYDLYTLHTGEDYDTRTITIQATKGVKFYTFTFG